MVRREVSARVEHLMSRSRVLDQMTMQESEATKKIIQGFEILTAEYL